MTTGNPVPPILSTYHGPNCVVRVLDLKIYFSYSAQEAGNKENCSWIAPIPSTYSSGSSVVSGL